MPISSPRHSCQDARRHKTIPPTLAACFTIKLHMSEFGRTVANKIVLEVSSYHSVQTATQGVMAFLESTANVNTSRSHVKMPACVFLELDNEEIILTEMAVKEAWA